MAGKGKMGVRVFRKHHDELCQLLDASPSTLTSFTGKLYSEKLVNMAVKREVIRVKGYQGADTLLDYLMKRLNYKAEARFRAILDVMNEEEALADVGTKIKRSVDALTADKRPSGHTAARRIPVSTNSTTDAVAHAKHLKDAFQELVSIIYTSVKTTDVGILRVRLNVFFSTEDRTQFMSTNNSCVKDMDSCTTPEAILLCLVRANFIGYLNYKLLEEFAKASNNEQALKSVQEYEQEFVKLFKCDFPSVMKVFSHPGLTAIPPVSLPDFKIRLGTKQEESNVYELKELLESRFPWAEHLVILDVTKNCVLIKYGVLPFFISAVVRDLTDPTVIKELKREDITIELSPELMKYSITPLNTEIPASNITSSDVVQFLRSNDVAITNRQKTQLLQQHGLTQDNNISSIKKEPVLAVLPTQLGEDSISGFGYEGKDPIHVEKVLMVYEKALKQVQEEKKAIKKKCDVLKEKNVELEEKLIKYETQDITDFPIEKEPVLAVLPNEENSNSEFSREDYKPTVQSSPSQQLLDTQPTVDSIMEELEDLMNWKQFVVHLPHVTESDSELLMGEEMTSCDVQRMWLINWLSVYSIATWDDIANALVKVNEFSLAVKILDHIPSSKDQHDLGLTITNLNKELELLEDWQLFAINLPGITEKHIHTIENQYSVPQQRIALFECWLSVYPEASWDDVMIALKMAGEHELLMGIEWNIHQYYEVPDVLFLYKKLRSLTKWEEFGTNIRGITDEDIRRISAKHSDLPTRKLALFSKWLSKCHEPSWNDVSDALERIGEWELANNIVCTAF